MHHQNYIFRETRSIESAQIIHTSNKADARKHGVARAGQVQQMSRMPCHVPLGGIFKLICLHRPKHGSTYARRKASPAGSL